MTITLNTKEFDEAVLLWLESQGFSTDRYSINTRVIAGRSDGPLGTRIEATLEPLPTTGVFTSMGMVEPLVPYSVASTVLTEKDKEVAVAVARPDPFPNKPSFSRGHSDV